jgi:hypothetical protein
MIQQLEGITAASAARSDVSAWPSASAVALWSASSGMGHLIECSSTSPTTSEPRLAVSCASAVSIAFTARRLWSSPSSPSRVITALPSLLAAGDLTGVVRWAISMAGHGPWWVSASWSVWPCSTGTDPTASPRRELGVGEPWARCSPW